MKNRAAGEEVVVEFLGYDFVATTPELIPRKSSETIVTAAVHAIENMQRRVLMQSSPESEIRVLDLGTGCGCLLLSLLCRLSRSDVKASGVGVDLSDSALQLAQRNTQARVNEGAITAAQVRLCKADFSKLHLLEMRQELCCEGTPFDVVLSNPPFLADDRAKGRITNEGAKALVGGQTGMEAYAAIASSIAHCKPPLLSPRGLVVFQAPGGERGHIRVSAVLKHAGFEVLEAVRDARGVHRAVVASPPRSNSNSI
ncbi:release factor glutamine methyltransferase-like [Convolutriloba macropyga]|uniref:release factor glutamine methyltransferase-like n=1 Tax=Convolutriloba macropyga TaxID=536237 RepID=UPI003F5252F6